MAFSPEIHDAIVPQPPLIIESIGGQIPEFKTPGSACADVSVWFGGSDLVTFFRVLGEKYERIVTTAPNTPDHRGIMMRTGERALIPTGIILHIPFGYHVKVYPRSGASVKNGLTLINGVGIVDSDYKDQLFLPIYAHDAGFITEGSRLAQLMLCKNEPYEIMSPVQAKSRNLDHFTDQTDRGGGFGSTGS